MKPIAIDCTYDGKRYRLNKAIEYHSKRYGKTITLPAGMTSDGASGPATDIWSLAWWVHDRIWTVWQWDDGTAITLWQSSVILGDILRSEGRWFRGRTWPLATYLSGLATGQPRHKPPSHPPPPAPGNYGLRQA